MQWLHCCFWPVSAVFIQPLGIVQVPFGLLDAVIHGNVDCLCWGGSFRLKDDCSGFCDYSLHWWAAILVRCASNRASNRMEFCTAMYSVCDSMKHCMTAVCSY